MKVLLATPPEYRRLTTPAQVLGPPIGLMYLAACLKDLGPDARKEFEVKIFDAFTLGLSGREFIKRVIEEEPDVLGVTVTSRMFAVTVSALSRIKEVLPSTKIILGGMHPTFLAREIVSTFPFVDFVMKGEAERSLPNLVDCISRNQDVSKVKGLTCFVDGSLINNEPDTITDLDALPFPAREMAEDVEYGYTWNGIDLTYGKFTSIVTSRGCPYTCNFCTNWIFSNRKWRVRSIDSILDEMELLCRQGYRSCVIIDDIFTLDESRVVQICNGIRSRGINLVLYCEGRIDNSSPRMFRAMRSAGFSSIMFGVESGSQRVLNYYRKGTTPARAKQAVHSARNAGLKTIGAFIVGAPVEDMEDFKATLNHIRELELDGLEVNVLSIAPWDYRFRQLVAEGKVGKLDWLSDHLVSDYFPTRTKEQLARMLELAYTSFFTIGRSRNLAKVIKYVARDRDARNAILKNLGNPYTWSLLAHRGRPQHKIEEVLMAGSEMTLIAPLLEKAGHSQAESRRSTSMNFPFVEHGEEKIILRVK